MSNVSFPIFLHSVDVLFFKGLFANNDNQSNSIKSCGSTERKNSRYVLFSDQKTCMETIDDDSSQRSNELDVIAQHFRVRLDFIGDKQFWHSI